MDGLFLQRLAIFISFFNGIEFNGQRKYSLRRIVNGAKVSFSVLPHAAVQSATPRVMLPTFDSEMCVLLTPALVSNSILGVFKVFS